MGTYDNAGDVNILWRFHYTGVSILCQKGRFDGGPIWRAQLGDIAFAIA